jgi:hypothetical protein
VHRSDPAAQSPQNVAIVSGTIADLGSTLRINCRLISTETGEVLSVAATTIVKDDGVSRLLAGAENVTSAPRRLNSQTAKDPSGVWKWTAPSSGGKKGGGTPARSTVHVGDHVTLEPDAAFAILDPLLAWADVQRANNRYPRQSEPVYVTAAANGEVARTSGEIFPWVRCTISTAAGGRTQHTWDFDRGLTAPPVWSPDDSRLLADVSDPEAALPAVVALAREGERHTLGRGSMPCAAADGTVYAAADDRIVRFATDGKESTLLRRPGESLDQPRASPDGTQLAYTAARANHLELRTVKRDGSDERLVLAWDRDRILYRWSPDGTRIAFGATVNPDLIQSSTSDIYVLNLTNDEVKKVVSLPGPDNNPHG